MYLHTKNEVSGLRLSEVRARTGQRDTQTHRDAAERITTPSLRVVIKHTSSVGMIQSA